MSQATDLVPNQTDTPGSVDVFLFERATGVVTLVSHAPDNPTKTANDTSFVRAITANGSSVAFESAATNLVVDQTDTNGADDVFVFDRTTGAVTLVSHRSADGVTAGNSWSRGPSMSADGTFVAFFSASTDLVAGQEDPAQTSDVFLFERASGATTLVSHRAGLGSVTTGASSYSPHISDDAAMVAFHSLATNFVPGQADTNGVQDVFLFERGTGTLTVVSHIATSATATANGGSSMPSISSGGRHVVFDSRATDLLDGQDDSNGTDDVFVLDRATGAVTLVSRIAGSTTKTANHVSCCGSISADGGLVTFGSAANNLVEGAVDTKDYFDVFLFQRRPPAEPRADFDGDGDTDVAVFRPTIGYRFVHGGVTTPWGTNGDIPVPGDYDGDDRSELAVFRSSDGYWYLEGGSAHRWGFPRPCRAAADVPVAERCDVPVPSDYDGDGRTDLAVFRPANGVWLVRTGLSVAWGSPGDIPVPGDYDGDGDADMAVFRPSTGMWFVQGGATTAWGTSGDIPVPCDYDGDGDSDLALFRPSNGYWFVAGGLTTQFGVAGDVPVAAPEAIRQYMLSS